MLYIDPNLLTEHDLNRQDIQLLTIIVESALTCKLRFVHDNQEAWTDDEIKELGFVTDILNGDLQKKTKRCESLINATLRRLHKKNLIVRQRYGDIEGHFKNTYSYRRVIIVPGMTISYFLVYEIDE
ncbi:hypothetical protein YTPLAS21_19290 [Candidatus Nitrosocosmicus sp.]|nr:hypothetical protein YTPLAS21_19290 [Candidatus Nitrosocosmicus sp.]